jgi:hypothetical protein
MTDTQVSTIAIEPPTRLRMIGRVFGEPEVTALMMPVSRSPTRPTASVTGIRSSREHRNMAVKGSRKPAVNDRAEAIAAGHGVVNGWPRRRRW